MTRILQAASRAVLAGVALAGIAAPALAADGAGLTIYNGGFGMVRETRTVALPQGVGTVTLTGLPAEMRTETVTVRADGVSVLEASFLPETLTPQALAERFVGKTVTLVRVNPATGAETRQPVEVLAVNDGLVVRSNGEIETVRPDGTFTRLVFDSVPEGLAAEPTLSLRVNSRGGAAQPLGLSYLANGLGWQANYVGVYDEARGVLSLQGWATLENGTSTDFRDARVQLMAGDVALERRFAPTMVMAKAADAMMAAEAAPQRESVGDYHLYTLPQPVTLLRRQTKQVSLVSAAAVKAERSYRFELWGPQSFPQPQSVETRVRFDNTRGNGLGKPLPAGTVRFYGQDKAGNSQFLGENRIPHTPEGGAADLILGKAFDVTVKPTLVSQQVLNRGEGPRHVEWSMAYELKNAKDQAVTVDLRQSGLGGEWEVIEESQKHERLDADTARWRVTVPAGGTVTVKATVRQRG